MIEIFLTWAQLDWGRRVEVTLGPVLTRDTSLTTDLELENMLTTVSETMISGVNVMQNT